MRIWRGRHAAPLIAIWVIAIGLLATMYKMQEVQPGLTELLRPVYIVVLGIALLLTWKWFRARARGKTNDRRHKDRRRSDRRDD